MPRARAFLRLRCRTRLLTCVLFCRGTGLLTCVLSGQPTTSDVRLLFTGDILLSRQVRREIDRTRQFPWAPFTTLFHDATWVDGNLEGAVGTADQCEPKDS